MTINRPTEPSRKISRGKIPWSPSLLLVISTRIPLPLTKPNREPDSKRIIEAVHTGQLPRAQSRAEMSTDGSGGQMIEIKVEDYVMVKFYHNNNNNTMKQKKQTQDWLTAGWNSNNLVTSCEEVTHWKRLWCWEGLGAGGKGDSRGWDGWMASPTWWTWVWMSSGSWWWTGRPGVLQFMGSQRVGHDWVTEVNWTALNWIKFPVTKHVIGRSVL